jgi:hypothetical protein
VLCASDAGALPEKKRARRPRPPRDQRLANGLERRLVGDKAARMFFRN